MNMHFNLTFTGIVSSDGGDPGAADIAMKEAELRENLGRLVSIGLSEGIITGDSPATLDEHELYVSVKASVNDDFPPYRQHTEASSFIDAFIASAYLMYQEGATGRATFCKHNAEIANVDMGELEKLLGNRDALYEYITQFGVILFDGGNAHGDGWKSTFYPKQLIQMFVLDI